MSSFLNPDNRQKSNISSIPQNPAKPRPTTPAPQSNIHVVVTHDQIANRACALWQAKGSPAGQDEQIWLEAEAQLKRELQQA